MNKPENALLQNETLNVIGLRHSIRTFIDKPIPQDHVKTILTAANQAPSAHNQQSWKSLL